MKQTVFIFHGTGGHPKENWFPWIQGKLQNKNCEVIIPQFPTPDGQSLDTWMNVFKTHEQNVNEKSIFIGHSLGGLFLLRLLENMKHPVSAAFFVATPIGIAPIKNWDSDYAFSNGFIFDWEKIKSNVQNATVYHSDNDPYVSLGNGQELAKKLESELKFTPLAGHFNTAAGYTQFDNLLKNLLNELEK